ncbi:hypothetical protein PROFUN_16179 [Planoprotostelium fungivorum]|uniref:Uncharacterized protein n=1 Tax=Planoprotostelium fungivorum TaxID=1890364 RepID=A0A2P6MR34_9EUKA|nr:hypothetical protein PROFUN_16179 [Planoprotostelium fungivorum]
MTLASFPCTCTATLSGHTAYLHCQLIILDSAVQWEYPKKGGKETAKILSNCMFVPLQNH